MTEAGACTACDIITGRVEPPGGVIYENEHWRVGHLAAPVPLKGAMTVKVKRHCESLAELNLSEMASLPDALTKATRAVDEVIGPERVYVCSFGEDVRHVHWWVLPRTAEMPAIGPEFLTSLGDGRWACSEEEAVDFANRARVAIAKSAWSVM